MAGERFLHSLLIFRKETHLEGLVSLSLSRLLLGDKARSGLNHRDRNDGAVLLKDLGHPYFSTDNSERPFHGLLIPYNLISTSIPAARSSFIRASTVCCVGSMMSMRRLWVRISNCSLDFLSTWGDLNTVKRLILVGGG